MKEHLEPYEANLIVNNPGLLLPGRPIAFNRDFVRVGSGVKGALMLSQAMYWSRRTKDPEGWFFKTQEEWEEETGLTPEEQRGLNKRLCELGFITIEKRGLPARNYYKVNEHSLAGAMARHLSGQKPPTGDGKSPPLTITENTTEIEASASKVNFEDWLEETNTTSDYEGDGEVSQLVFRRAGKAIAEKTLRREFAKAHPTPSVRPHKPRSDAFHYDYESYLKKMENSSNKVDKIIAFVWRERGYNFDNYEKYKARIGQDVKYAKELSGYSPAEVKRVIDELYHEEKKLGYKWSMSTIAKRIANTTL